MNKQKNSLNCWRQTLNTHSKLWRREECCNLNERLTETGCIKAKCFALASRRIKLPMTQLIAYSVFASYKPQLIGGCNLAERHRIAAVEIAEYKQAKVDGHETEKNVRRNGENHDKMRLQYAIISSKAARHRRRRRLKRARVVMLTATSARTQSLTCLSDGIAQYR